MPLSTKQYLLLNNIMYLGPEEGPFPKPELFISRSVGEWMRSIDLEKLCDGDPDHLPMTTAEEWKNIIAAVRKDPLLSRLRILTMYTDLREGGGTCKNAVFLSGEKEAVVVFKGTDAYHGMAQWEDNFLSANAADSPHQIRALEWYRKCYELYHLERYDVTLTGHSKGGNKAKYITILDPTVRACVSFDGEGFSDKFFDKYRRQIAAAKDRIENHFVNYDYIGLLMNNIGRETFYYGNNIGTGGFTENHLPNTFLRFDADGEVHLDEDPRGRPAEMQALNSFANSFLRSQDDGERSASLKMFIAMLRTVMSLSRDMSKKEIGERVLDFACDPENSSRLAYFLAYLIRYQQRLPEVTGMIYAILIRFDLDIFIRYVSQLTGMINWKRKILWRSLYAGDITRTVSRLNRRFPEWAFAKLDAYLKEKTGIILSDEQIRKIAGLIDLTDGYLHNIVISEDISDREVPDPAGPDQTFMHEKSE